MSEPDLALASQRLPARSIVPAAVLLLDYGGGSDFPYPLTIQKLMHLVFFFGLGELLIRWATSRFELSFLDRRFLPEDDETVLQAQDLGAIRRGVAGQFDGDDGLPPSLIDLSVLQFHAGRSVDQMVGVLNSSLELIAHRVDLRFWTLRYAAWLLPTLGFIGTVTGIAQALGYVNPETSELSGVAASLGGSLQHDDHSAGGKRRSGPGRPPDSEARGASGQPGGQFLFAQSGEPRLQRPPKPDGATT